VIIVRLPFAGPSHPLIQGRIERLRAEGINPFYEYQMPMAILKFKQGFGRLIRRKTDQGIIAVLDSRILQKSYGKQFLQAIPKCPIIIEP
jgi:ATP-dependent DNA helicase DinG